MIPQEPVDSKSLPPEVVQTLTTLISKIAALESKNNLSATEQSLLNLYNQQYSSLNNAYKNGVSTGTSPIIPVTSTSSSSKTTGNYSLTDFMARYGAQAALAAMDPQINDLLQRAMAEDWTPEKFQAEFMNTNWFKTHSVSWRNAIIAQQTDPAEYAASLQKVMDRISRTAIQNGVIVDPAEAKNLATSLLNEYWGTTIPDDVMNVRLAAVTSLSKIYGGKTMSISDNLKQYASAMGVKFDQSYFDSAAKSVVAGASTMEQWTNSLKDAAKSRFPMFATQIDAGATVRQIASPYLQTLSGVLEVPVDSLSLDDPTVAMAFDKINKDGQPAVMGLWEYEKMLKRDPRWKFTKNARSAVDNVGRQVLQDFGLAY